MLTIRAVARLMLVDLCWTINDMQYFPNCKLAVEIRLPLKHCDRKKQLTISTDASDSVWYVVSTQIPPVSKTKTHAKKALKPLPFLSGHFRNSQSRWLTVEKEAFPIMAKVEHIHHILTMPQGLNLYTDHANVVSIFGRLEILPNLGRAPVRKALHRAVCLYACNYTCIHINSSENIWTDLQGQ